MPLHVNIVAFFRYILSFLLLTVSGYMFGQSMSVSSFEIDEKDLTANVEKTMKLDLNGDKCALIKIETTQHNFSFDVGSIGVTEVVNQNSEHPSEIWLYVPHGVKSITIQHPILGTIRDYDLGLRVKKGKTYILKLTSEQVNTMVVDYNNSQYLVLDVYPKDANVFINGIPMSLSDSGILETPLAFGLHNYRITATNYHTSEGQISIHDKENKQSMSIRLKQAFGYVNIKSPSSDLDSADIYIDEDFVGKLPLKDYPLKSGQHKIKVIKELYLPYSENITVTDSGIVNVFPNYVPNYAKVEIMSDNDAQIFDNGRLLGVGKWEGRLEAGKHIIEAKKKGHKTSVKEVEFVKDEERMISIDSPTPIYGILAINSEPANADVYIDGEKSGKTPFKSSNILVGEHEIKIAQKGYKTETEVQRIDEGKAVIINKQLTDYCSAIVSSNILAKVYLNGKYLGNTPYKIDTIAGIYNLELKKNGYADYSKRMALNGSTENFHINLSENYVNKNEFYFLAGYNPIGFECWSIGAGVYIWNVNAEINYLGGVGGKENIYWSDGECMPRTASYSPNGFNGKLGYGFLLNSRIRITPQIGIQNIWFNEKLGYYKTSYDDYSSIGVYDNIVDGANTTSITYGCKLDFIILPNIGITVTPEYYMSDGESKGYEILSKISTTIKNVASGFNCSIKLNIFY